MWFKIPPSTVSRVCERFGGGFSCQSMICITQVKAPFRPKGSSDVDVVIVNLILSILSTAYSSESDEQVFQPLRSSSHVSTRNDSSPGFH